MLFDQAPPLEPVVSVTELPVHTLLGPVIAAGSGFTVTAAVVLQPVGSVYITVVVPVNTPANIPVVEPIVAMAVLPESHVPPPVVVVSVVEPAGHTCMVPVMDVGSGFTVNVAVAAQPVIVLV